MSVKDGGPAFPSHGSMGEVVQEGMTLREYFAAAALANMRIYENTNNPLYWERVARAAYIAADAMLAERAK